MLFKTLSFYKKNKIEEVEKSPCAEGNVVCNQQLTVQ